MKYNVHHCNVAGTLENLSLDPLFGNNREEAGTLENLSLDQLFDNNREEAGTLENLSLDPLFDNNREENAPDYDQVLAFSSDF